jgi:hypothetical protein
MEQGWAVRRGVSAAGGDAQSAPDRECASRGDRVDAGLGRVPRCDRHRDLCHSACEPCTHSTHACRARSVPSVTSAPCRPPRSQVSDACRPFEFCAARPRAVQHRLSRMPCVATLRARAAVRLTGRVLNCTQSGSRASPNGDAVCCGYAAQALERARLPPSALPLPYVMNELNGDDRVSRLRAA